jgi:hypothetical protein
MRHARLLAVSLLVFSLAAVAQEAGVLPAAEARKVTPSHYFYAGQVAPVQMRNAAAFRTPSKGLIIAALVDNSGYSSAIAEKYQGLLIADTKFRIGGQEFAPGSYGIGSLPDGKFVVTDLGSNILLSTEVTNDAELKRPVPLKMAADGTSVRLYLGKKYVVVEPVAAK